MFVETFPPPLLKNTPLIFPERSKDEPVAAPMFGVTSVGDVANTKFPVPVSPVTADAKFAGDGVAKKVATLVPNPDTPVEIGNPVAFVSVADDGVPRTGETSVGDVANTKFPVPVSPVTAVRKLAGDGVAKKFATPVPNPDTPVEIGNPVAFVRVPPDGVPKAPLNTTGAPADPTLTANAVTIPVPNPDTPVDIGNPVAFVSVAEVGVPRAGVTRVGPIIEPVTVKDPEMFTVFAAKSPFISGTPEPEAIYNLLFS